MMNIFKKQYGMNIVGQGGKIILFMLPSLIAAILVHTYFPRIAGLPADHELSKTPGISPIGPRNHFMGFCDYQVIDRLSARQAGD